MFFKYNININALIKCWIFFMACFAIARYPLQIAIVLGLVGGLAGGALSQWWQLHKNPEAASDKENESTAMPKALGQLTKQLKRFGLQSKEEQKRKRKQPRVGLFGGVRPRR